MTKKTTTKLILFSLFTFLPGWPGAIFGQAYTITDLGALGGSYSEAHGINKAGNVVGDYDPGGSPYVRAFYYQDGTNSPLGTLGGIYAVAYAINDTNQIVGESAVTGAGFVIHAFVSSNGVMTDLGTLEGGSFTGYSSAHAVNRSGQIVGESSISLTQPNTTHAVLYSGGTKTDLGVLGGDYGSANGINNSGVIVGESSVVSQGVTNIHAFVLSSSSVTKDLGTLGGGYSSAKGINDSGVIVGEAETVSAGVTNLHAFIYRNGAMADLGTFGGSSSSASAINSVGMVVGYAYDANEVSDAFLYNGSSMMSLINFIPPDSGWTNLTSADSISDSGQITGSGLLANGEYHAYLLTPTITLASPTMLANGQFQVTVRGVPGQSFVMQASPDLFNWVPLSTNTLSSTSQDYIDGQAANFNCRYYRALLLP